MNTQKKARALVLDDMKERHDSFDKAWSHFVDIDHVHNLAEFRAAFEKNERYDVIAFDHDLNDYVVRGCYGGASEITGLDVAMWMLNQDESKWPTIAYVHSWNMYGALSITSTLQGRVKNVHQMISTDINLASMLWFIKELCT